MKIALIALAVAALGAVGTAVTGWATARPALHLAARPAPASTVTLTRTARLHGIPLRAEIALLRRAGRTVTLDVRLRDERREGRRFWLGYAFDETVGHEFDGVSLIDPTTGRKLSVKYDADGDCLCSTTYNVSLAPGGETTLSASFPAPSPSADTADVVVPNFGAFRDVPLG